MEKSNQVGSSSSSFTVDLFGPKQDSSKSSTSSSTGLFGSIFGPPTIVRGRDTSRSNFGSAYGNAKHDYTSEKSNMVSEMKKEKNGSTNEPYYYNSSIYYGGQQVYSPTNHHHNNIISNPHHVIMKKDEKDDPNESNSNCASRGNWWQGSLYY